MGWGLNMFPTRVRPPRVPGFGSRVKGFGVWGRAFKVLGQGSSVLELRVWGLGPPAAAAAADHSQP